jgi:HlyD family secretion protein
MTTNNSNGAKGRSLKIAGVLVLIVAVGLAVVWLKVVRGAQDATSDMATFVAKRGPLIINVLEAGTIKAREQEIIYNQVEGRTSIVWIVPEGTVVKKGDLLVKLDVSTLTDSRIDQEIRVQNANAAFVNAKENFEIVKNQAVSDVNVAELTLQFAKQDLKKYTEGQYPNELAAAKNDITLAEEELTRAQETLDWSERLFKEKYISQTEKQADELARNRSQVKLEVARNDLKLLETFTYQRQIAQLQSDVHQAEMSLERTQRKANANVVQAEADLRAKEQEYNRQKDKLAKLEDQLQKATVYAPTDGMVIYATSAQSGGGRMHMDNRQPLQEGVEVFERQELIYLPTAASSKAEVAIHEASLQKVRVGLPAVITVDALPGKKFFGTVAKIAPLPDPQSMWMNPDLKVYNSDVYLDTDDPSLRTGMSCKVEIVVARYDDAVYVPVQAVVRIDGKPTVYVVNSDGTIEERKVEIGLDNNSMVRIVSGLNEGETVWLTPPLKTATVGQSQVPSDVNSPADTVDEKVGQRLDGSDGYTPPSASRQPGGFGQDMGFGGPRDPNQRGGRGGPNFSPEQAQRMMENMTPEQRQQMEQMRQRFQNMTPEEREQMRQQFQGRGGGQGRGQRQRGGQTPGAGQDSGQTEGGQ